MSGRLVHTVTEYTGSGRSWVCGSKFVLLSSGALEWQAARDQGREPVGRFYTNMAQKFIAKYGWYWDFKLDKDCPDPSPEEWANVLDHTGLEEDEIARRKEYFTKLREKIVNWYLTYYGKVSDKKDQNMEVQKMITQMVQTLPKPPRRRQLLQFYSHKYYEDPQKGIKAFVHRTWPAEKIKPVPHGTKKMTRLDYGNKITAEYWARETDEFKVYVAKQRDEEYNERLKAYNEELEAIDKVPETPESYHQSLANAAAFLQPVADLAAKRFGAAVSILMVLPIGANNGNIEMCSVHSGQTKGLNPQIWPHYDKLGFQTVQDLFVDFGRQVFSEFSRIVTNYRAYVAPAKTDREKCVYAASSAVDQSDQTLPAEPESQEGTPLSDPNLLSIPDLSFNAPVNQSPTATVFDLDGDLASFFDDPLPVPLLGASTLEGNVQPEDPFSQFAPGLPTPSATPTTPYAPILNSAAGTNRDDYGVPIPSILPDGNPSQVTSQDQQAASGCSTAPFPFLPMPAYSPPHSSRDLSPLPIQSSLAPTPSLSPPVSLAQPLAESNVQAPALSRATSPQNDPEVPSSHLTAHSNSPHASCSPTLATLDLDGIPAEAKAMYAPVLQRANDWGEPWSRCVDTFLLFERSRGFDRPANQLAASKQCPALFKKWVTLHRPDSGKEWDVLVSGDGVAFGAQWWEWWVDIQPSGRRVEGAFTLARRDAGLIIWKRLSKSGVNGMLLVLVGLVWWKLMIGDADDDWRKAVTDVTWALHEMKSAPLDPPSKKRKCAEAEQTDPEQSTAPVSSNLRAERKKSKKALGIAV
ncbi:hypothetical protein HWV62_19339 [Athelia sp. TMB]|nr:hypothetical protein HWV62_19339 [Athelia sp. TMB]